MKDEVCKVSARCIMYTLDAANILQHQPRKAGKNDVVFEPSSLGSSSHRSITDIGATACAAAEQHAKSRFKSDLV